MTPADAPYTPPNFSAMTTDEILAFFNRYGFRDPLGHSLSLCQDFIDLISTHHNFDQKKGGLLMFCCRHQRPKRGVSRGLALRQRRQRDRKKADERDLLSQLRALHLTLEGLMVGQRSSLEAMRQVSLAAGVQGFSPSPRQ